MSALHKERARKQVLVTVMTYPLPSRTYGALVCTAGLLKDGSWIRMYPVAFEALKKRRFRKYDIIELELEKSEKDFRPESWRPIDISLKNVEIKGHLDTKNNWEERKRWIFKKDPWKDMDALIKAAYGDSKVSLAVFQPRQVHRLVVEKAEVQKGKKVQPTLFDLELNPYTKKGFAGQPEQIEPIPWKFSYEFEDTRGKKRTLMIEDWEIGQLYRNCLVRAGDPKEAVKKVRKKYEEEFLTKCDVTFFLGTTLKYHKMRAHNPFVIIGVFYPRKEAQLKLFDEY